VPFRCRLDETGALSTAPLVEKTCRVDADRRNTGGWQPLRDDGLGGDDKVVSGFASRLRAMVGKQAPAAAIFRSSHRNRDCSEGAAAWFSPVTRPPFLSQKG